MLSPGTKAPNFTAPDQDGNIHSLSNYIGKWVVLYFYPKDDTPGCTKEACNFRDNFRQLQKIGVVILGVSKDSVESHKKFAAKFNLNFPLLSDTDKKIIDTYGVWGVKKIFGHEFEGIKRTTYLINPKGNIAKIYEKVNPLKHVAQIKSDLEALK